MLKDLQQEKEINDDKILKSKTELKIPETAKEKEEEIKTLKKQRKVSMDGLKSFSSQNLVKIDQNGEISENEEKTSPNSPSQQNNIPIKELYEEEEKDYSEEDDAEGEEINENKKKETEEEELMVPNNMKKFLLIQERIKILK